MYLALCLYIGGVPGNSLHSAETNSTIIQPDTGNIQPNTQPTETTTGSIQPTVTVADGTKPTATDTENSLHDVTNTGSIQPAASAEVQPDSKPGLSI